MGNAHPNHALANSSQTKGGNSSSPPQSEHGGDGGDDEEKSVLQVCEKCLNLVRSKFGAIQFWSNSNPCCRQS